jgi:hypothetical protein
MDDKKNTFITKDSGEHQQFETGARRDTQVGKGRYDLIPPQFLRNLALALEEVGLDPDVLLGLTLVPMGPFLRQAALYGRGAKKYGPSNYLKGIPLSRTFNSLARHAAKWAEGMDDEDHLAAVAWNAFAIIATEDLIDEGKLPETLADLGPKTVKPTTTEGHETVGRMWSWIDKILNGDPGEKVTD